MPIIVSDDELKKDVDAYRQTAGNRSEAARLRKLPRNTFRERLMLAEKRFGITLGKIADGRVDFVESEKRPLPKKGGIARYILTSAQNNTHPHKGLQSLLTYRDFLDGLPKASCELIIGTFSYAIDAYGAKAVKRGTWKPDGELWYAPELLPYIHDVSIELAPGLVWCGEMNILPTAKNPLTGMETYNGRNSNIVPHATIAMESIASLPDEATKFNYATGAVTLRNYIQKRAGIMGERRHSYGALLVEVDSDGNWYVRQLEIGKRNEVYDIGPSERKSRGIRVTGTKIEEGEDYVDSIVWGDIHAAEMDLEVRDLCWGKGGMLDQLTPSRQFMHDIFSMRARGHHEIKNFHRTYQKMVDGEGVVEDEMRITADFITEAHRPGTDMVVVRSNHCRHLDRWLNEAKPNLDPVNAKYFMRLQFEILDAMDKGNRDFNILEWALRHTESGIPDEVLFLGEDESFVICKEHAGGIECGLHGDLGPNGSRGSTRSLSRLARRVIKNHDHKAGWYDMATSGGACSLNFPYMKGPNAHSVTHTLAFKNAARQLITCWGNKFRA